MTVEFDICLSSRIEEGDGAQEVMFADGEIAKEAINGGIRSERCSGLWWSKKRMGR